MNQEAKSTSGQTVIAVLSDSHGLLRRTLVSRLQDCSCILHAGDIVRDTDLDELRLYGNLYAVRGNCDRWVPGLQALPGLLRFSIAGVSFCMVHAPRDVPRDLTGVGAVVYGHTHQYREEWIDGRLWLNPGSCGRARFGSSVSMARLTLGGGKILDVRRIDFSDFDP